MSPDPRPGPYRYKMDPAASNDLMAATTAYFPVREAGRVAAADQIAEYLLTDDPLRNGRVESEGLYRLVVSPLTFLYEVYPSARQVQVTAIRYFPV